MIFMANVTIVDPEILTASIENYCSNSRSALIKTHTFLEAVDEFIENDPLTYMRYMVERDKAVVTTTNAQGDIDMRVSVKKIDATPVRALKMDYLVGDFKSLPKRRDFLLASPSGYAKYYIDVYEEGWFMDAKLRKFKDPHGMNINHFEESYLNDMTFLGYHIGQDITTMRNRVQISFAENIGDDAFMSGVKKHMDKTFFKGIKYEAKRV